MSILKSILNLLRFNKKNWKAVALCLFAATIFWFFNALNKTYTANIKFPLEFEFNSTDNIAVTPLPKEVNLNVTGIGWNLFRKSSGLKVSALVIALERPAEVKKIVGSTLPALFSNQLDGLVINFVLTDTLFLQIQPKEKRWLTVTVDSVQQYVQRNYSVMSDVKIIPDSIQVEGPESLVNNLKEPISLVIQDSEINQNFRQDVEVTLPDDRLMKRNPPTVAVSFDVDKLIERRERIALTLKNIPAGAKPVIGEAYIPCVFSIPQRYASDFVADSVKAVIDLSGFKRGNMKVMPQLTGLPPASEIISVDSIRIKL